MAFAPTQTPANNNAPVGQNENWRKDAFLNFSLPDQNGNPVKLGSIGLKNSKVRERKLIQWLLEDPAQTEARCKQLLSKLIVECRNAEVSEDAGFDLG